MIALMIDLRDGAPRLALYGAHRGPNGIGRVICNLANGVASHGVTVDLLVSHADSADLALLDGGVRVVTLGAHQGRAAVARLADYLQRERPTVLLGNREWANRQALAARRRAAVPVRLAFRVGSPPSAGLTRRHWPSRLWHRARLHQTYRQTDRVIAISAGVATDVLALTRLPPERVVTLKNPSIPIDLDRLACAPAPHPWLDQRHEPVVLAAGRLVEVKDFVTLLRAFATLRRQRPARLVVLGEGPQRGALLSLAEQLGVAQHVALPGFSTNPVAWMARAALFVVSSRYEGGPNVLIEALACGTPAVSTDCPHGPREILDHGRWGRLVPVGDAPALAAAMAATLEAPLPAETLRAAMAPYRVDTAARAYLAALWLLP
jgi:glycosyltransferase involved in cell wall biosynthesis